MTDDRRRHRQSWPSRMSANRRALVKKSRSEAGDTLIELLIALVVIGLASVALLAAFATSITASAEQRTLASLDTLLKSYVETAIYQIQQQPVVASPPSAPLYSSCAATYTPTYTLPPGYTGYTVSISASTTPVQYWETPPLVATAGFYPTPLLPCRFDGSPTDYRDSHRTINNVSDTLSFVVMIPTCRCLRQSRCEPSCRACSRRNVCDHHRDGVRQWCLRCIRYDGSDHGDGEQHDVHYCVVAG